MHVCIYMIIKIFFSTENYGYSACIYEYNTVICGVFISFFIFYSSLSLLLLLLLFSSFPPSYLMHLFFLPHPLLPPALLCKHRLHCRTTRTRLVRQLPVTSGPASPSPRGASEGSGTSRRRWRKRRRYRRTPACMWRPHQLAASQRASHWDRVNMCVVWSFKKKFYVAILRMIEIMYVVCSFFLPILRMIE